MKVFRAIKYRIWQASTVEQSRNFWSGWEKEETLKTCHEVGEDEKRLLVILFRSVKTNRRQTLKDVTARFNQRTSCNVSSRTVCRRLFWEGYKRRVVSKPAAGWILSPEIALDSRSVVTYNFQWWDKDNTWAKSQNLCLEKGWCKITSGMCRSSRRLGNHMSCISNALGMHIILWRGNTDTSWREHEHWKVYLSIRR
jgi:hypothetical protein